MRQVTERLNFRDFDTVGLKSDWLASAKLSMMPAHGEWESFLPGALAHQYREYDA